MLLANGLNSGNFGRQFGNNPMSAQTLNVRSGWSLSNRSAFGNTSSKPIGYYELGLILPFVYGGIGSTYKTFGESSTSGEIQANGLLNGSSEGISSTDANVSEGVNRTGLAEGNSTVSTPILSGIGSILGIINIGARPSAEDIAQAVWGATASLLNAPGTFGEILNSGGGGGGATPSQIADAVWDELLSGHTIPGSAGEFLTGAGGGSTPSVIADAVRTELTPELNRIDVNISTRSSQASVDGKPTLAQIEGSTVIAKESSSQTILDNQGLILTEIGNITPSSASIHVGADSFVQTVGTVVSGTYLDTRTFDEGIHILAGTSNNLDAYYEFNLGTNYIPTNFNFTGHSTNNSSIVSIYAYNWDATTWEKIGEVLGTKANNNLSFALFQKHISNTGFARIRFASTNVTQLHVDLIYAGVIQRIHTLSEIADAVWDELLADHGISGSAGAILRVLTSDSIANSVRTELALELSRIDVAISSRLASASYSSPPSPSTIASQVRTELATELGRIDVILSSRATQTSVNSIPTNPLLTTDSRLNNLDATISSRLPTSSYTTPPTASANASAVRTELTTELNRIDANISSRLASIDTTAIANAVWSAVSRTLTSDLTLSPSQIQDIAIAVEQAIINEADGQQVIDAIVQAIGNENISASTIASAVRSELATELGRIDTSISSRSTQTSVDSKPSLSQIEASTILAKESTVNTRASQSSVNNIPTNPLLTTDSRLNNLDATISSRLPTSSYVAPSTLLDIANAVWTATTRSLNTDVNVSSSSILSIAQAVEQAILNEGDGNAVINAIVTALGSSGITPSNIADTVRTELAVELARIDLPISSRASQDSVYGLY